MSNSEKLKILMLEDSPADAEMVTYEIRKKFEAEITITDNYEKFKELVKKNEHRLILADYNLLNFTGIDALRAARAFNKTIPYIFVSGAIGEENVVEALKLGATDYVLKSNLSKLPFAISRAVKELEESEKLQEATNKKEDLLKELLYKNKILNCLFRVSELIGDKEAKTNDKLRMIAELTKDGFINSGKVSVQITLDGEALIPMELPEKNQKILEQFSKEGSDVLLEAFYDTSEQDFVFTQEETDFLRSIRDQIINMFDHVKADEKLINTVIESEERERKRIAGDIHDNLQQMLVISNLNLNAFAKKIGALNPGMDAKSIEKLGISREYLQKAMEETRSIAHKLAPHKEGGIINMINALVRILGKSSTVKFNVTDRMEEDQLDPNLEINLFRVTQEMLNNIMKHANAKTVEISVSSGFGKLILSVVDDGEGFDQQDLGKGKATFGFTGIVNRVKSMNGEFNVNSKIGIGTFVQVTVPLT